MVGQTSERISVRSSLPAWQADRIGQPDRCTQKWISAPESSCRNGVGLGPAIGAVIRSARPRSPPAGGPCAMEFVNETKVQAGWTLGFERNGRELLIIAIKATYNLPATHDDPVLAEEQNPLVKADEFTGEPGLSATLHETDYAPRKLNCDVVLNGSAYAPGGRQRERSTFHFKWVPCPGRSSFSGIAIGRISSSHPAVRRHSPKPQFLMTALTVAQTRMRTSQTGSPLMLKTPLGLAITRFVAALISQANSSQTHQKEEIRSQMSKGGTVRCHSAQLDATFSHVISRPHVRSGLA